MGNANKILQLVSKLKITSNPISFRSGLQILQKEMISIFVLYRTQKETKEAQEDNNTNYNFNNYHLCPSDGET